MEDKKNARGRKRRKSVANKSAFSVAEALFSPFSCLSSSLLYLPLFLLHSPVISTGL